MVIKSKTIDIYEIHHEDEIWMLHHEKEVESYEEYYIVKDLEGIEVVDEDLYEEIIKIFEHEVIEGPLTFEDLYPEDEEYD